MKWDQATEQLHACMVKLHVSARDGVSLENDAAFRRLRELTLAVKNNAGAIFIIGNGASASMASHVSADLAKNAYLHTQVFSDLSLITAMANDISYDQVFAEPLRRRMQAGDMLVGISSSGNSPNIINAAHAAHGLGGSVITLSAMQPGNALRKTGDLNFYVPAQTYGLAETAHAALLHHWIDIMVAENNGG